LVQLTKVFRDDPAEDSYPCVNSKQLAVVPYKCVCGCALVSESVNVCVCELASACRESPTQ